ncbi:MSHA biogenesis protein MshN [Sulfuriferula multivorans]|uniref:MSHA biogenesis protein MshN n=1 Tax=Sulfuriferula multivorans TaxID=1559896 RepID=A0A401JAG5_9PROT|nr:tetratricopeptide repeat protein [Sulfuriferula multivorans]GBL44623.1 MSHA biogenesis protein MshN [Sulfuriferula multivorans]
MSVINQMLQDLENRHSARETDASISAQLRAVPKRSRIHPAWWVILLLTLTIVAGMLVWRMWPSRTKDAAALTSTAADALATQEKNAREAQRSLQPRPSPGPSQHALPDLKLAMQISAAQELSSVRLQATENRPLPELQPVVLPASRVDPVRPAVPANTASPQPDADSGKPNPVALAQALPAPGSRVDTGRNSEVATAAVAKQIKEITPQQRAENEYGKAISLLQQGRTPEAIELLGNVLQFDPGNTAARQTLVGLLVAGKRYGDAERSLRDGLKLNPGQTGLAMIMARLQVEQGDTQSALKTLQHSLPYAAELPDYQAFLAALLQREGRNKEAIEHYLLALRKVPGSGVWLMGLGISLQAEKRQTEAQEAFLRAKASNTLSPDLLAFVEQQLKQSRQ